MFNEKIINVLFMKWSLFIDFMRIKQPSCGKYSNLAMKNDRKSYRPFSRIF